MPRKSEGNSATAATAQSNRPAASARHLQTLRNQIDKLDLQLLKLINERASLAAEIGRYKNDAGEEVFSPQREEEVLQTVVQVNDKHNGPLEASSIRAIYREIVSASRALQKVLRIAYLGPEYSYSHLAAIERFGQTIEYLPTGSIAAVFEEVVRGHVDFGVVPLENSTDGRVADTLDMFLRLRSQEPEVWICSEVRLPIHHHLLANCEPQEIRRVYSKAQAISQCRNWLSKNLPHASLHVVSSTADAARLAQQEPGAAAVASEQAAARYGLRVLFSNIEDYPNNETRFAVIGRQKSGKTGHDKTAIMFRVPHSPGALVDALDVFKQARINLTWIESFPAKTEKPEYIFFADFEGHIEEPKVARALKALGEHCHEVTVLGSFPMAQ
jgi:chorismate mutase/prephenate dehydratase